MTKERRRWLVAYRGIEFYVHLDWLLEPPAGGYFLEVKSRTWSQRDARDKAAIIAELLALFGSTPDDTIGEGYVGLACERETGEPEGTGECTLDVLTRRFTRSPVRRFPIRRFSGSPVHRLVVYSTRHDSGDGRAVARGSSGGFPGAQRRRARGHPCP